MKSDRTLRARLRPDFEERARWREAALARWDNEGGALSAGPGAGEDCCEQAPPSPPLTNTELVQLQIRVIALENLVITLLAHANETQLEMVREMAAYISPRPGFTPHRLTIHAAGEMISLVERAHQFRLTPRPACSAIPEVSTRR